MVSGRVCSFKVCLQVARVGSFPLASTWRKAENPHEVEGSKVKTESDESSAILLGRHLKMVRVFDRAQPGNELLQRFQMEIELSPTCEVGVSGGGQRVKIVEKVLSRGMAVDEFESVGPVAGAHGVEGFDFEQQVVSKTVESDFVVGIEDGRGGQYAAGQADSASALGLAVPVAVVRQVFAARERPGVVDGDFEKTAHGIGKNCITHHVAPCQVFALGIAETASQRDQHAGRAADRTGSENTIPRRRGRSGRRCRSRGISCSSSSSARGIADAGGRWPLREGLCLRGC